MSFPLKGVRRAAAAAILGASPALAGGPAATVPSGPAASGDEAADLQALRQEIEGLRREYGARIEALEARLRRAEAGAHAGAAIDIAPENAGAAVASAAPGEAPTVDAAPPPPTVTPPASAPVPANTYNPGVFGRPQRNLRRLWARSRRRDDSGVSAGRRSGT